MRSPAVLDGARDIGSRNHLCLRYDHLDDFVVQALDFLSDGLAAGHRVLYVGPGDTTALAGHLSAIDGIDEAIGRDAVRVASLDATYPVGTVINPAAQVRAYAAATEEALAAGFHGLRVAAEATDLVRTPAQLDAFARYEHLVGRYMVANPFSALCAYDRGELGDDAIAQLACLHPRTNPGATAFRLHPWARDDGRVALEGEIDSTCVPLLLAALERADPSPVEGEVVIDGEGLRFIDHHGLLALADHAERRAVTLVLRTSLTGPARLLEMLDVGSVRVEQAE